MSDQNVAALREALAAAALRVHVLAHRVWNVSITFDHCERAECTKVRALLKATQEMPQRIRETG